MDHQNGAQAQKGDLEVTGVSRSGRVRKKSSKLMDFQSPDEIETRAKKPAVVGKQIAGQKQSNEFSSSPGIISQAYASSMHGSKQASDHSTPFGFGGRGGLKSDDDLMHHNDYQDEQEESDEIETEDDEDDMPEVIDNEEGADNFTDPTVRQSIYMSEKSNKKKVMKDGKMVYGKAQRKDKGKTRFTAYMLWARDARKQMLIQQPDLGKIMYIDRVVYIIASNNNIIDFGSISRRLGEMWANVPMSEKLNWKRRLKRFLSKPKSTDKKNATSTSPKFLNKGQNPSNCTPASNNSTKTNTQSNTVSADIHPASSSSSHRTKKHSQSEYSNLSDNFDHHVNSQTKKSNNTTNKVSPTPVGMYKVTGIEPVDVAAHLKLLGDSLTIIGERLKEHEGQITVSGSLSVLLDSLLCSLGPLMCLTTQIPGFNEKNQHIRDTLHNTLDNIAYVMPGL